MRFPIRGRALERPLRASSANLQAVGRADATEPEPGRTAQRLLVQSLELLTSWVTSGSHLAASINGTRTDHFLGLE